MLVLYTLVNPLTMWLTLVTFVGYAVIAWLLRYISTHTFLPFVIYRLGLATLVAVLLLTGVLEPLPQV